MSLERQGQVKRGWFDLKANNKLKYRIIERLACKLVCIVYWTAVNYKVEQVNSSMVRLLCFCCLFFK